MPTPSRRDGVHSSGAPPEAAGTLRLLHRRRGWAWTGAGSLIGFIVYGVVGAHLFPGGSGTAADLSAAVVIMLLVLGVFGLVVAVVETVRLRRIRSSVRAAALAHAPHYPIHAHPYRYPPRHRISWVFMWVMFVIWIGIAVILLPNQVNGVAYLADPGRHATFLPVSYGKACSRGGCSTVTDGVLDNGGGADVTWPGKVPLGQPFTVRTPVWRWGTGRNLINSAGAAVALTIMGLFFEAVAVAIVFALIAMMRAMSLARRQQAAAAEA